MHRYALRPGDSIYIVAPASRTENAELDLARACQWIQTAGFVPLYEDDIFAKQAQSAYNFANEDEKRYQSFVRAVQSNAKVIWCFRGGYGCDRVAGRLFKNKIKPKGPPKLLVGFSDITVLQHYCYTQWQWPVLHAPVLNQIINNKVAAQDVSEVWQWLQGERLQQIFSLQPLNEAAKKLQHIEANIVGGNLMVIQSMMGTPWETPRESILLLEEVNEAPYRVARVLQQWLLSGWLDTAKAVILGDFINEPTTSAGHPDVLEDFAQEFARPVLQCRGIGHGEHNQPIPLGVPARLELGKAARLEVKNPFWGSSGGSSQG